MTFFDIDQGFNGAGIEEVRIEVGPSGSVNKTTLEKPKSLSKVLSPKKQALNNQVRKSHQLKDLESGDVVSLPTHVTKGVYNSA